MRPPFLVFYSRCVIALHLLFISAPGRVIFRVSYLECRESLVVHGEGERDGELEGKMSEESR